MSVENDLLDYTDDSTPSPQPSLDIDKTFCKVKLKKSSKDINLNDYFDE